MEREPKPSRLKRRLGTPKLRLTQADRSLLADLARCTVIDSASANTHHYTEQKSPATRRLDALVNYGLLGKSAIVDPNGERLAVYQFADKSIARSFGGAVPAITVKRQTWHEVLVSRLYFASGRPADFRTSYQFSDADYRRLGARPQGGFSDPLPHHAIAADTAIPDALYSGTEGELIVVEADTGHYTTRQIAVKQQRWKSFRQVWGQPKKPHAKVAATATVDVHWL